MSLLLQNTAKEMLSEMAIKIIKDLQALFKKGHIGWTANGNRNIAKEMGGETMTLLIKGTKYDKGSVEEEAEG